MGFNCGRSAGPAGIRRSVFGCAVLRQLPYNAGPDPHRLLDQTMADEAATPRPRIMVVLLSPSWLGAARLPGALTHAGFSVASYCHPESYLSKTRYNEYAFTAPATGSAFPNLVASVRQYQPLFLIPACELAVRFFLNIIAADASGQVRAQFADVVDLVRRSLGEPAFHRAMQSKIETSALAEALGLRVPEQVLVQHEADATDFGDAYGYPLVFKGEYGHAGNAVRICATTAEAIAAYSDLGGNAEGQRILVQRYIRGVVVTQSSVALAGQVLETVTLVKHLTHPAPMGPSSVLRWVENTEAEQATRALLGTCGTSGFSAANFIVEHETNAAYFIEFNPRVTPPCIVARQFGRDLCRALWCRLSGVAYERQVLAHYPETVALFPNEWLRDPHSPYLTQGHHDVPWDDPTLLKAYVNGFVV